MFQRFFDDGLAQSSYLVGCARTKRAFVVDPRRDVDAYVEAAAREGFRIEYAIETHIHADFVSGARELQGMGVRTVSGPGAALRFDAHEVRDGETLEVGDLRLTFLHTPGHTPEHICIRLDQPDAPVRLFSGDTLFVGAVGRPDLLGEELTRRLAGELYDSLFGRLLALPDDVEVHPGHGAGSLCGAGIGNAPYTTIGEERQTNAMLRHASREAFVTAVLGDLPETPPYFPRMKRINHSGPEVLGLTHGIPALPRLSAHEAAARAEAGAWLVDLRSADLFGAAHPKGAVNIGFGAKVGYWAGFVVPADTPLVLLSPSAENAAAAARQLLRVGLDRIEGLIEGGLEAWRRAGLPVASVPQISVAELAGRLSQPMTLVDVRTPKEWRGGHIDGATHIPLGDVTARAASLPDGLPVLTLCEGGYRSSLAASLLLKAGRPAVTNVTGGMAAWRAAQPQRADQPHTA